MKISKWAYSIEEGPIEPCTCTKHLYASGTGLSAPILHAGHYGFPDCWPPIANYATTWDTYFFGNIICCTWFAACCSPF